MKKILFNMLIAVAAVSIFASCTTLTPDDKKAISIETTEFSVPAEGGDIQVKFIPSLAWTATCEESWLTLSPASGDASESEIIMTVKVGPNASSQRIAAIVLSTESGDVNLSVTQEGFDYSKILEQTEYDIPIEGEEIKIKFIPPVDWTAKCDAEWVYLSADSGKASKTKKTLTITVDSNEGGNARKAVINLYFGDEEVVVTLRQKGENATTPDNPSGPDNPSDPDNPSNPDNPSDPDNPSNPDGPSNPDNPSNPDDPSDQDDWVIEMTRDGGDSWSVIQNLEYKDGFFFFDDLYVDEGEQVSIYFYETNAGVFYGCSYDFRDGSSKTNTRVELVESGAMLNLSCQGYYDIYLNPEEDCFFIMSDYLQPSELPTMEPVLHETYESLETTYENQIAKVRGYVLAKNAFGYILAIDAKYDNYILLYDPYHKVDIDLGYSVDIYAAVKTYNDLKELDVTEVCWYSIIDRNYHDTDLRNPLKVEYLSSYNAYGYDYLSVTGRLESSINPQNGRTEYTLIVQSPEYFEVIISQPYQDLAEFVGKPVVVEGFHMGHNASGSTPTLKIMLKRIWHEDSIADSSTEDVLYGGSIIVTNN